MSKVRKGQRVKTVREIDCRHTGGPLIPKGSLGTIVRVRRTGELWVDLDEFGDRHLLRADVAAVLD